MPKKKKATKAKEAVTRKKKNRINMLDEDIEELVEKKAMEAKEITEKKAKEVEEYVKQNPLQAVTVAFFVGFILGKLVRK